MKKFVIFLILVFALLIVTQSALFASSAKKEIIMLVRAGPEGDASRKWVEIWNEKYAKEKGFTVKQIDDTRADYYTKINNTLMSGAARPDILLTYSGFLPMYASAKLALDITDWFYDKAKNPYDINDWLPIALELASYKGRLYGFPTDTNTYLLFYRKDLIPNPPKTWQELYEVAKKFTKSHNKDSKTLYGLAFYGRKSESLPMFWYQIFRSWGGTYWYDRPAFNSYPAVKALEWVVNCIKDKVVPPDIATYEYMEILGALQTGQVAMAVQWDAAYPTLTSKEQSPLVYDKIDVAEVPGIRLPDGTIRRQQSAHDLLLMINPNSKFKEEAFEFLAWATQSKEGVNAYAEAGASPPHKSVLENKELMAKAKHLKIKIPALKKYGYPEPALPDYPKIKDILGTYLAKAWALEMSPKDALDKANKEIYDFMKEKGYY